MTSQKLTELREAIALYCPEIMELSMGYKMRSGSGIYTLVIQRPEGIVWDSGSLVIEDSPSLIKDELIGHDIFLHHVLRAIKRATESDGDSWWFVDKYGSFGRMDKAGEAYASWNLLLPLDEQEPVTIDFLHSIICKPNTKKE